MDQKITRREFLKLSGIFVGALALSRPKLTFAKALTQYPEGANLGRICAGQEGAWFELKTEPYLNAPKAATVWRDDVVEWKREVVTTNLDFDRFTQRWVETPNGYMYSPWVQPVKNHNNQPLQELPTNPDGTKGMWVEITKPVVDIKATRIPAASYWIREVNKPRIYYSQVFWAYDIRQENGAWEYLLTEKWGAEPDSYWADATACRPITPDEMTPIHPDVGDKYIKADLNPLKNTLSCYEGGREVYFCEVSSGGPLTPQGIHTIWRKMISTHMSAGGVMEFDTSGIGWTTIFDSNGAAIHAAFWHNNFGTPLSHGCINCKPKDAKWIWRWANPQVAYYPGELTVQGGANSTQVEVFS
ncbi:MAG: L,D-transpeptidase [Anaerolineaceae bacterium]